jgi:hypothetical protein
MEDLISRYMKDVVSRDYLDPLGWGGAEHVRKRDAVGKEAR